MDERQLDNYFKDHLDNFQDEGNPDPAWGKMGSMLDRYAAPTSGFFISRQMFWSVAAVFLLLICSFLYGMWNQSQQMKLLHTSLEDMREELDGGARMSSGRVDTLVLLAGPDGKLHSIKPAELDKLSSYSYLKTEEKEAMSSGSSFSSTYSPIKKSNLSNISTPSLETAKNLEEAEISKETLPLKKEENDLAEEMQGKEAKNPILPKEGNEKSNEKEEIKHIASSETQTPTKKSLDDTIPKEKERTQFWKKLGQKLGFRNGLGVHLASGGTQFGGTETAYGGALGMELQIGERFALRSGASVSQISYELGDLSSELLSEDFTTRFPGSSSLPIGAEFHEIKMSGTYFEIPIGIRYFYPINRKMKVFSGFDLSGGAFLNENFTYEIYEGNRESYSRAKATDIPWNWGTARFSLGTALALNSKWDWEAALFFEKDLGTRGVEEFSYYMVGLSSSFWLRQ